MIWVSRLGKGEPMVLNTDLVLRIEALPDTTITLTTGDRLVVRESVEEVVQRVIAYQRQIHEPPRRPRRRQPSPAPTAPPTVPPTSP